MYKFVVLYFKAFERLHYLGTNICGKVRSLSIFAVIEV
jgi:hypothetical protein